MVWWFRRGLLWCGEEMCLVVWRREERPLWNDGIENVFYGVVLKGISSLGLVLRGVVWCGEASCGVVQRDLF